MDLRLILEVLNPLIPPLTTSKQTQKWLLTLIQPHNQQTMNSNANIQLKMFSNEKSLTPKKELDNGGKSNSVKIHRLMESKFSILIILLIEKTAAVKDWQEQKFTLMTNIVDLYQVVPKKGNGMMSNA